MMNNLENNEMLVKFRNSVYWGSECEFFQHEDRTLMKHTLSTINTVFIPCHHENYMQGVAGAIAISSLYKLFPWVLMYGDADDKTLEHLWHLAYNHWADKVHISWVYPTRCRIRWARLTIKASLTIKAADGIDWVKIAENFNNGSNNPIWTWDK